MKKILSLLMFLTLTGCGIGIFAIPNYFTNPTPDERLYMEKVRAQPLEFEISEIEAKTAWGRAQSFIGQYSSMKLQIVTDYVIQTYNPTFDAYRRNFGYYVTKTPIGNNVKISVQCLGEPPKTEYGEPFPTIELNAHILAHYIKTGELPFPQLIDR